MYLSRLKWYQKYRIEGVWKISIIKKDNLIKNLKRCQRKRGYENVWGFMLKVKFRDATFIRERIR